VKSKWTGASDSTRADDELKHRVYDLWHLGNIAGDVATRR
jgi:hypothetical protein